MRLILFFLMVSILFFPGNLSAGNKSSFSGVKAGFCITKSDLERESFNGEDIKGLKGLNGFDFAVFSEWAVLENLSLLGELHYIQKGSKWEYIRTTLNSSDLAKFYAEARINYLSIPVLLKLSFGDMPLLPYVLAGPRMDVKLNNDIKFRKVDEEEYDVDYLRNFLDDSEPVIWGIDLGLGIELDVLPLKPLLELRYSHNLKDEYKMENADYKNLSYQILLGIKF